LRKKNYIYVIMFLGITIFSLNFNHVTATDNDGDDIDDEFEELNKRNISLEIEVDQIQIESSLRSGDQKDEIQLKIKMDTEGLGIEVNYEEETTPDNTTEFELEFGIIFRKLIEFVDLDDDSIYDPSVDDIIQEILLDSFQAVIYMPFTLSDDTMLHYFIVNASNGVFTAHIYFSEEFHIVNGSLITPIQTKMDIEISNFPYTNTSSQIALYTSLESEINYEEEEETEDEINEYASNEKGLTSKINNFTGIFTWNNNATIDDFSRKVLVSEIAIDDYDGDEQKMYLSYSRGTHIYHDPKVGIAGIYITKEVIDNPIFLNIVIIIISSLSLSIAYTSFHFRARIFTSHYAKLEKQREISSPLSLMKYDSETLDALLDNTRLLHQLEDLSTNKMSSIKDIKVTALSVDFFKIINIFAWEEDDLVEFIREMKSLTPEERKAIFKEMINKSEQQKKGRLEDTKRLYT